MKKSKVKRLSERVLFRLKDGRLVLKEATDIVDGQRVKYTYRSAGNLGVVIIPVLNDGRVLLERQYRPVVRRWLYELPGGKRKKRENARAAAVRELEEETGYKARKISLLYKRLPAPWSMDNVDSIFLATNLVITRTKRDEDERIETIAVEGSRIRKMIKTGAIEDSGTREALLYWLEFCSTRP